MTRSDALGGSWAIQARYIDNILGDLIFVFSSKVQNTKNISKGAFGFAGIKPLIMLAVLKAPYDLQYIETRISGMHESFVHEFMHYLSWKRNKRSNSGSASVLGDDRTKYYNHADELNAYYQEAAGGFEKLVVNVISLGHRDTAWDMWGCKTTPELVREIMNRHINDEFIEYLTPSNRRKIEKRLARFVEETIRPMFANTASE